MAKKKKKAKNLGGRPPLGKKTEDTWQKLVKFTKQERRMLERLTQQLREDGNQSAVIRLALTELAAKHNIK